MDGSNDETVVIPKVSGDETVVIPKVPANGGSLPDHLNLNVRFDPMFPLVHSHRTPRHPDASKYALVVVGIALIAASLIGFGALMAALMIKG